MAGSDSKPGKEISWQEFQSHLLETGMVDRIVITNKNMAKVQLRPVDGSEIGTLNVNMGGAGDAAGDASRGNSTIFPAQSPSSFEDKGRGMVADPRLSSSS